MKSTNNNKFLKVLPILCLFLVVVFIYQLTIANDFSFSVGVIDRYLHFCESITLCLILLTILTYFFIKNERLGKRITIGLVSIPVVIFFAITILFSSAVVFANDKATMRHYFFQKDQYQYYLTSERFWAFEGSSNLAFYKEKTIFLFIKHRPSVTYEELEKEGLDMRIVTDKFYAKYFK